MRTPSTTEAGEPAELSSAVAWLAKNRTWGQKNGHCGDASSGPNAHAPGETKPRRGLTDEAARKARVKGAHREKERCAPRTWWTFITSEAAKHKSKAGIRTMMRPARKEGQARMRRSARNAERVGNISAVHRSGAGQETARPNKMAGFSRNSMSGSWHRAQSSN